MEASVATNWIFLLGAVAALGLGLSYLVVDDRWKLMWCAVAALAVLGAILVLIGLLIRDFLTPIFFVGAQMMPAVFFLVTLLVVPGVGLTMHPLPYLLESPRASFVALIEPSLGFLAFAVLMRTLRGSPGRGRSLRETIDRLSPGFEWLLILAALLQFSLWITGDEKLSDSLIAYGLRIAAKPVALVPFLAGYTAFKFRFATLVWVLVFVVGIVFSFFTGSRGYAYLPLIPFLVGLLISLKTWRQRIRLGLILSPALGLAFFIASLVGELRNETGRMGLSQVSGAGIGKILDSAKSYVQDNNKKQDEEFGMTSSGIARMVAWPNIAVPVMTPDFSDYRGFWDIENEFSAFFSLGRFSGNVYFSNAYANLYGFYVDDITSVEFGIVADGASRAGTFGAVLYGLIAALILAGLEKLAAKLHGDSFGVALICAIGLCGNGAFDMARTGLFTSVRSALIGLVIISVVFRIASLFSESSAASRFARSRFRAGFLRRSSRVLAS